jgi:4-hydroxyphenylacetate decarboxylase small subunit
MKQVSRNLDCRHYAPIDVAKGICHFTKEVVLADGETCDRFERLPKCRDCQNYIPSAEEYLGTCNASTSRPMTYPDLTGSTCEWFIWKEASCRGAEE